MSDKYIDKIFVAVRNEEKTAYVTYFSDDKGFEKRANTGRSWANVSYGKNKEYTEHFYDNVPTAGFKVIGFSTRYSTDNKVIDIEDSRGFSFQVYMSSFVELLKNCTIINGIIQDELIYVFCMKTGQLSLVKYDPVTFEEYKQNAINDVVLFKPKVGEYGKRTQSNEILRYLGYGKVEFKYKIWRMKRDTWSSPNNEYVQYTDKLYSKTLDKKQHVFVKNTGYSNRLMYFTSMPKLIATIPDEESKVEFDYYTDYNLDDLIEKENRYSGHYYSARINKEDFKIT